MIRRPSSFPLTGTLRSVRSWTRWRPTSRAREQREELHQLRLELEALLLETHQAQVRQFRVQLLESMGQLAQALERQDSLLLDRAGFIAIKLMEQEDEQKEQRELLAEVLNSLQPSATQQLGVSRPQKSLPNLGR